MATDIKMSILIILNYLLRLNLSNLAVLEKVKAFPDHATTSTCLAKGQSKDECHNFFRAIIRDGSKILTCGTNSFSPLCQWRKIDSLSEILSTISGVGKCPYSPHQNSTLILTSDQNLYGATVTDFAARDPAIYRMVGPLRHLRTNQYNSRWLNEPDFVSSYEIGPYVYFFFRETAIEYINCGKVIYSRVARICQNDQGGNVLLQDNWTTFSKARLNCSIPGLYPFHLNELQNTLLDIENELIYAIFSTSPTGILGSAVCLFNLSSLEYAFHGPFKYQHDSNSAWNRYPNKLPHYQCGHNLSRDTAETTHGAHVLLETSKYQLMDRAVQPRDFHPVVVVEDQRYTHISKDEVWLPRQNISIVILFLASLSGYIDKMAILPGNKTPSCLIERIRLSCGSGQKIKSMELLKKEKHLLVGTYDGLHKIPVHRCSRFSNEINCHNSQDPYCGWDDMQSSCKAIGHQNLYSCPIVNFSATDKSVTSCNWSPWQQCHHVTQYNSSAVRHPGDKRCLCRTRDCACLYRMDGRYCGGREVEITNCSYPSGKKYLPSFGHWLPWSEWSNCIGRCSKGHQTRSRSCHSTRAGCYGNSIDIRECRANSCEDTKTGWSHWHVSKENKIARVEEKHRCTCKIDPSSMTSNPILETVTRTCDNKLSSCSNESHAPESALMSWSDWSECSVTCGFGGIQRRHKLCFSSNNSCNIESQSYHQTLQEVRSCNSRLPCQTNFWSCWSPLSSCSVTCGRGVKYRTRVCLDWLKVTDISEVEEGEQSDWCPGVSKQEMICETHSCIQNHVSFTAEGQSEFFDMNYDHQYSRNFTQSDSSIQSYHLIIVGVICFFLGGIVIIIVLSHCKLSFLFAKERYPTCDGAEKCNAVAAFTSDGVRTAAARYPYFASNGVAPVTDNISQKDGSNITNSSKTPLISAKRLANTCQR